MPALQTAVIEEAESRAPTMRTEDLLVLIERAEGAGVAADRLHEYAAEIERRSGAIGPAVVESELDDRLVESTTWAGPEALYGVGDGRVSAFPAAWTERLAGETDIVAVVETILADVDDTEEAFQVGGSGEGVPESVLLEAAVVCSGLTEKAAKAAIERKREQGVFTEDADQHPDARVRLADADAGDAEDANGSIRSE